MDKYAAHDAKRDLWRKRKHRTRNEYASAHKSGLVFRYSDLDIMTRNERRRYYS